MFGGTVKLNPLGLLAVGFVAVVLILLFRWNDRANSSALLSSAASAAFRSEHGAGGPLTMKRLLIESIVAAEKGGLQVAAVYRSAKLNVKSKGETKEGVLEPVTDADMRSNRAMKTSLERAFKGQNIRIISEEHNDVDKVEDIIEGSTDSALTGVLEATSLLPEGLSLDPRDVTIWIDPLDATKEFTEDLREYVTVLVCVAIKSEPIIGVVHRPFKSETFWAWAGQGRSVNLRLHYKTDVLNASNETRRIIVSRSHAGKVTDMAKKAFGENVEIIPAGGAGYKVLQVILGKADAYVHVTSIKKWDICAGNALLGAVDGRMTTLKGQKIEYDRETIEANEDGLLATLHNQKKYLAAMKAVLN